MTKDLSKIVGNLLDEFYRRRIEKISTLQLKDTLRRKNPYLYKAIGMEEASGIVNEILAAYMSSSDEGIFGDAFFEPLAESVANGYVGHTEGIDVVVEDDTTYKAIAVKSGTNVFNADSRKRQADNFRSLRNRVAKRKKIYDAIVGYCYGKKHTKINKHGFRELAGQSFWEELTDDPDFYLKIINAMENKAQKHLVEYNKAYGAAVNRFTKDFINEFCNPDGTINWEKLVKLNSGKPCQKLNVSPLSKSLDIGEELQLDVVAIFSDDEQITMTQSLEVEYEIKSGTDVADVDEYGITSIKGNANPGNEAKIIVSCFDKSRTVTIKVKKKRKKSE